MGYWDTHPMGGDHPLDCQTDFQCDFVERLGLEPKYQDDINCDELDETIKVFDKIFSPILLKAHGT